MASVDVDVNIDVAAEGVAVEEVAAEYLEKVGDEGRRPRCRVGCQFSVVGGIYKSNSIEFFQLHDVSSEVINFCTCVDGIYEASEHILTSVVYLCIS